MTANSSSFEKRRDEAKLKLNTDSAMKVMSILGKGLKDVGTKTANLAVDTVNTIRGEGRPNRTMSNEDMEFITIAENIRSIFLV